MKSEQEATIAIERHADMIRRICFLHLKSQADTEDIFQNVFLKYVLYPRAFESSEHEKAWLLRVAINECKDLLKSFYRKNLSITAIGEEIASTIDENRQVLDAVLGLPKKYKDVIYLFYYEGYSAVEIAKVLGKNENTIYTWLSRGKKILREELGGEGLE